LMSRVVVIDDYIVWVAGEAPKVERYARHQGHCETAVRNEGDRADRWLRIDLPEMKSSKHRGANRVSTVR
jgi:hypothetical protein